MLTRIRPLLLGAAAYLALVGAWRFIVTPLLPEELTRLRDSPGTPWWDEESGTTVFTKGGAHSAPVLVLGDSRVQHGFRPEVFAREGVHLGMVYGAGGQLSVLLPVATRLPARRWIIVVGPMILHRPNHEKVLEYQLELFRENHAIPFTERVDRGGNDLLDGLRLDAVRTLQPRTWQESWFDRPESGVLQDFVRHALRRGSRAERWNQLQRVHVILTEVLDQGWEVICLRMPQSAAMLEVQDLAFPADAFPKLCKSLGIAYLDHSREPFPTKDGLHLTYRASLDYDRFVTQELRRRTDWFDPH